MEDTSFKMKLKYTFVSKICDPSLLTVKAAIITAASKMAINSEIATEEQTIKVLMELYELNAQEIGSLIGMSPTYAKSLIGYSVDYNDYGRSKVNYDANKSNYDIIYNEIAERSLNKKTEKQI